MKIQPLHNRRPFLAAAILTLASLSLATSSHAGEDVPYKSKGFVVLTSSVRVENDPDFVIENEYVGEATATQLGKHLLAGVQTFTVPNTAVAGVPVLGSFSQTETHIAANGDELFIKTDGVFLVLPIDFGGPALFFAPIAGEGIWQVVGGTGRFENASGGGAVVTGLTDDGTVTFEMEGLISSLGSRGGNRKK